MSLTVHQSDRTEILADILISLLDNPKLCLKHPLTPEIVVLNASGTKRFLNRRIARSMGTAMNIDYPNTAAFFWQLMYRNYSFFADSLSEHNPFNTATLRWQVLQWIQNTDVAEIRQYCQSYQTADYALSGELAQLLNQYSVYRPDWIQSWRSNQTLGLGASENWQKDLWLYLEESLGTQSREHSLSALLSCLQQEKLPPHFRLPERVFVFAVGAIAPIYLSLWSALAQHTHIHFLALNPCKEFWEDVYRKDADNSSKYPLLALWGQQGREFFQQVNPISYDQAINKQTFFSLRDTQNDMQSWSDENHDDSILHAIQKDILDLRDLSNLSEHTMKDDDDSIIINSAYTPLRELQMVKDAVFSFLDNHPDASLDDVAILSPNIERYASLVDAVFGGDDGLAYSLADTKITHADSYMQAWEALLIFLRGRFEISTVMPLLNNECVLQRFGLTLDDGIILQALWKETHVHFAWDQEERQQAGGNDDLFTWRRALNNITASFMLPENQVWQNMTTLEISMNDLPRWHKALHLLQSLADIRHQWLHAQNDTVEVWIERILNTAEQLFNAPNNEAAKHGQAMLRQEMQQWRENIPATFKLTVAMVMAHLSTWHQTSSDQYLMRSGITLGSLVPLRALPFRFIALLGLDSDSFPRRDHVLPFDLMVQNPEKGDRSRSADDRYLFLETLMSTRDCLYLSYVGKDVRTGEDLAMSSVISELVDVLIKRTNRKQSTDWICQHPLYPFDERYFSGSLKSYRQDYADALKNRTMIEAFYSADLPLQATTNTIDFSRFLKFWKNPIRFWLQHQLAWKAPYMEDVLSDEEPFEINAHNNYGIYDQIADAYIKARLNHRSFEEVEKQLTYQSVFPTAELGKITRQNWQAKIKSMNHDWFQPYLPAQSFHIQSLSGSLKNINAQKQQVFLHGKLNAAQKINAYVHHLVASVSNPEIITFVADPDGHLQFLPINQEKAEKLLHAWVEYYWRGLVLPLPFFPKLSLEIAEKRLNKEWEDIDTVAEWSKNEYIANAIENKTVFRSEKYSSSSDLPVNTDLFRKLIDDLLVPFYLIQTT